MLIRFSTTVGATAMGPTDPLRTFNPWGILDWWIQDAPAGSGIWRGIADTFKSKVPGIDVNTQSGGGPSGVPWNDPYFCPLGYTTDCSLLQNRGDVAVAYRGLRFPKDKGLPMPARFMFAYYPKGGIFDDRFFTVIDEAIAAPAAFDMPYEIAEGYWHKSESIRKPFLCSLRAAMQPSSAPPRFEGITSYAFVPGSDGDFPNTAQTAGAYNCQAGEFLLRNENEEGCADITIPFGPPGNDWIPITGSWDWLAPDSVGLYDKTTGTFHLRQRDGSDLSIQYQPPGWSQSLIPLAGDWNELTTPPPCPIVPAGSDIAGDGRDTIGYYDPASCRWWLRDDLGELQPPPPGCPSIQERSFVWSPPGVGCKSSLQPITGRWCGDGKDKVGLYDPDTGIFYLRLEWPGCGTVSEPTFRPPGWAPNNGWKAVVGDWKGDNTDTPGYFDPSTGTFHMTNETPYHFLRDEPAPDPPWSRSARTRS